MYIWFYEFNGATFWFKTDKRIADLDEGFWVNAQMELAAFGDEKYWIPPSRIRYVEREI